MPGRRRSRDILHDDASAKSVVVEEGAAEDGGAGGIELGRLDPPRHRGIGGELIAARIAYALPSVVKKSFRAVLGTGVNWWPISVDPGTRQTAHISLAQTGKSQFTSSMIRVPLRVPHRTRMVIV